MEVYTKNMSTNSNLHRKCQLALVAGLLVLGATLPAHAQLGLGLVPMRSELTLTPGQEVSGALRLSSESGAMVRIRAEVDDFDIDATTTPQFERDLPNEAAFSCKKWLSVNPMEIQLDQGGFLLVRYTFRVPADVTEGGYNCAAGFTTLPPADQGASQGMGMHTAVRIVAAFYIKVGAPAVAGALKAISLEAVAPPAPAGPVLGAPAQAVSNDPNDPKSGWQAVVVLENSGKIYFRPTGKLEVLDANGNAVETDDFPSIPILPERSQRVVFALKTQLQPGNYKLKVNVDIGTGEIQEGTADVTVDASPPQTAANPAPK
jgi:hypothetical protein